MFKPLGTMSLVDLLCSGWVRALTAFNLGDNQYLCLLLCSVGGGMFSDVIAMLR